MFNIMSIFTGIINVFATIFNIFPSNLSEGINPDNRIFLFNSDYKAYVYKDSNTELPFRFLAADSEMNSIIEYPLVVFLHGSGERGTNNRAQMESSLIKGIAANGTKCFVAMFQCPKDGRWADEKISSAVTDCVKQLCQQYAVDKNRIYITGLSMGGCGTFDQIYKNQGFYAGAIALCGYYNDDCDYSVFKSIPLRIAHGTGDPTVDVECSRKIYVGIKASGGKLVAYEEIDSNQHNIWDDFYKRTEVWNWLFTQVKV